MTEYAWVITRDYLFEPQEPTSSRVGLIGPRGATEDQISSLRAGDGRQWRCRDDDGEVYYEGRLIGDHVFGPLDDFCGPDSGCVSIEYLSESGTWEAV